MFYKKKGFPEEGEIVVCTVKKILPTSVFVILDEYANKEGIVHISEIAPGRIRTIRDYVKERKKILCKILRVNKEKGHIDLSLRRATKSAQINKNQELKQEQKAEKVLEILAHQLKTNLEGVYKRLGFKIIEEYGSLNSCFKEVIKEGEKPLTSIGIETKLATEITKIIKIRLKPPEIKISYKLSLKSRSQDGIDAIKRSIKKGIELAKRKRYNLEVSYIGSPHYKLTIKELNYKEAEKEIEEVAEAIITSIEKEEGEGELIKK